MDDQLVGVSNLKKNTYQEDSYLFVKNLSSDSSTKNTRVEYKLTYAPFGFTKIEDGVTVLSVNPINSLYVESGG